jgi:hypothetical protein
MYHCFCPTVYSQQSENVTFDEWDIELGTENGDVVLSDSHVETFRVTGREFSSEEGNPEREAIRLQRDIRGNGLSMRNWTFTRHGSKLRDGSCRESGLRPSAPVWRA